MSPLDIDLPWDTPPLTQNGLRRMHHHAEARAKRQALAEARWAIRAARPQPHATADVTLHWLLADRHRRDTDGAAPTLKIVLDALVAEGILPDDSWAQVPQVTITTYAATVGGQQGALWVTLTDCYIPPGGV